MGRDGGRILKATHASDWGITLILFVFSNFVRGLLRGVFVERMLNLINAGQLLVKIIQSRIATKSKLNLWIMHLPNGIDFMPVN